MLEMKLRCEELRSDCTEPCFLLQQDSCTEKGAQRLRTRYLNSGKRL